MRLAAIGWDHERCLGPMRAAAEVWAERTDIEISWQARSLLAFGDEPFEELARVFDLLVIDHPFVGTAYRTGCLLPLDELLPGEQLEALAADAIGQSHTSYAYGGHQWGLATDAACQVSAVRDDLLAGRPAPRNWVEVLELARELPGRVAIPLRPADAISAFLTLCANAGAPPPTSEETFADPDAALQALELLGELTALADTRSLELDPPRTFDLMTSSDEIVYVPLAFGYASYSWPERGRRLCFLDIPSAGRGPVGSILGGAGLAVSAWREHPLETAAFAAWATGAEAQRTVVFPAGGQPGSRSAWLDPELDRASGGFFSGTRTTIESAYVRPRDPWWPPFQIAAGEALNRLLREPRSAVEALAELERLHREARRVR